MSRAAVTMLRILIVTTFFPPQNSIASLRPLSWAKYWTAAGHDVTVLTPQPVQGSSCNVLSVPVSSFVSGMKENYQRTQAAPSAAASLFNRLRQRYGIFNACRFPDLTELWVSAALDAARAQPSWDLVVSTSGPYTTHRIASKLKYERRAARWVADYRDLWSDNHIFPGLFPFNYYEPFLERRLLRNADCLTTVSDPLAATLRRRHPGKNIAVIENGFDPDDLANLSGERSLPDDGIFRIVYTGTFYPRSTDPEPLFRAIRSLPDILRNRLEVLFFGPPSAELASLIEKHHVGRWVKQHGFVSRENALRLQRDAHALLFLPWKDSDGILTGKIFEYLYSRTPIIAVGASSDDTVKRLISDNGAGNAFHNQEILLCFLQQQLLKPTKASTQVTPRLLDRYNRKQLAEQFLTMAYLE